MGNLSAFLHPAVPAAEKEVFVSDRFRDEKGEPVPFKIKALTQEENDAISRQCRRTKKVNGQPVEYLDQAEYSRRIVLAGTLEPNFAAKELCDHFQVLDPAQVPGKMLLAGEFTRLLKAIMELSGFGGDLEEEAKN